jgi:hypothetical protein
MLPGIIHLIQSLGGKAQGALGSVGADNSKEKLAGGGLNSAIMSALQKILGNPKAKEGMPEPPPNG